MKLHYYPLLLVDKKRKITLSDKEKQQYYRHILLQDIGLEGQKRLKKAKVLVVGAGGLGCPVLQYLAAAGVGTLGVIDFDSIESSNLQRQILFGTTSLGQKKAIVAKEKLQEINPFISITAYPFELHQGNAISLFNKYHIIVDATDNYNSRYLINDASFLTQKPMVYASIYKYQGQLSVFNYKKGPSYRCLFPEPPQHTQNCSQVGVLGVLAGIMGGLQANEVIKLILRLGQPLSGKMLLFNAKTTECQILKIPKNKLQNISLINLKKTHPNPTPQILNELTPKQLYQHLNRQKKIQFIDLRADNEQPKIQIFEKHKTTLKNLQKDLITVLYCQSGIRSKEKLIKLKKKDTYPNLFHLKGGVEAWTQTFPKTKTI